MAESVAVIHGQPGRDFGAQMPYALVWKTCLREIAIVDSRQLRPEDLRADDEVYSREEGYRFLLEVICGLHSPLIGETEVFGQFKSFAVRAQEGPGGRCTAPWMQRLIADAKRIRTNHLMGLGGRSYGQLAERHLAGCPRIFILGAGHLAQETIPSLADHHVDVFCRRPEAATALLERHPDAEVHRLDDSIAIGHDVPLGLIVAAPMSAAEITAWIARIGCRFETVVDLRGESRTDGLEIEGTTVIHFKDIVEDLESNRRSTGERLERAREESARCADEFWQRYEVRPFGWEELCA
jgi:glutamyl-tRNA reductase